MKILVTGAGGMLGSAVVPTMIAKGHSVVATDLISLTSHWPEFSAPELRIGQLDVREKRQIESWLETAQPDHVMHLAAETDVDKCEVEPEQAYTTNTVGTELIARACLSANLPMTYISTAGVFDGLKDEPYTEEDPAYPINSYGQTKLDGEQHVRTLLQRYYIVRAGWMVGGGSRDHKFVAKILQQLDAGATTLYAVGDKLGTPTYAPDFANCLAELVETDYFGTYHMACQGSGTRHDVARKLLDVLGRPDVELVEVDSTYFQADYPAPRPRSEMMRNVMLERRGLNTMRPWEIALEEYLLTHFANRIEHPRELVA